MVTSKKLESSSKLYTRKDILYHEVLTEQEEKEEEESRIVIDDIFTDVGDYGKYQKLLLFCVVLPACIPCGLQGFNQLFMANDLPHSCRLPDIILLKESNFTTQQLKRLVLPIDSENRTSSCFIKDVDWSNLLSSFGTSEVTSELLSSDSHHEFKDQQRRRQDYEVLVETLETYSWQLIPCPNGWDYEGGNSIVKDFDLVCGREIYPTVALFLVNLGGLFGVFLFGMLSDLIGRKWSFFACLACEMIGGIGSIFAIDFWTWTFFRVLVGLTVPAIYQIPFIICLELVGPNYRAFVTVMTSFFYVAGMMLLPLIAFLEPDWKLLSLYTTLPFVLYFLYIWFLPESIRWLLAQGRGEAAVKILKDLARVNGRILPQNVVDRIGLSDHHRKQIKERRRKCDRKKNISKGLLDLFRGPNMRLKTLLLTLCWFSNCTVYVGLSYYGPKLGENPYLSFFLSSAIEVPGYILCWILMDRWGRRWPLCLCMLVGGAFDIATVLLSPDSEILLMCFYLTAKLGISASYLIIYPFAGELYPTEVRGIGLGFSAYIGGIGLCCIPLINYLGRQSLVLPLVVMGVLSVIGGCAGLRLPETLNAPLSQTIEEGEEFGKNFTWHDCIGCSRTFVRSDSLNLTCQMERDEENERTKDIERGLKSTNEFQLVDLKLRHDGDIVVSVEEDKSVEISMEPGTISQMTDLTQVQNDKGTKERAGSHSVPLLPTDSTSSQEISKELGEMPRGGGTETTTHHKRLVRQSTTLEVPMDSTGAFIITPWW